VTVDKNKFDRLLRKMLATPPLQVRGQGGLFD